MMNNGHPRITVVMVLVLGLLLAAALAVAGDGKNSVKISTDGEGDELIVVVSEALARSAVEGLVGSELSCDGTTDGQFKGLLQTLDQKGRGSRASLQTEDSVIRARRRTSTVTLDIRDLDDDGRVEIVMPWSVAECLLGRSAKIDASVVEIKIKGENGGTFEFKVD